MINIFAAIDMTLLIQIAIFGGVVILVWLAIDFFSTDEDRVNQRLDEIKNPELRNEEGRSRDSMAKLLEKASPALAKPLQPKTAEEFGKIKLRLLNAGYRNEQAPSIFLSIKFLLLMVGFFISGGAFVFSYGATQEAVMGTVAVSGIMFYLADIVVFFMKKSRQDQIFYGLPDALDLMVVCVEAGLGLDQAMRKVTEEMEKSYPVLSEEFALSNFQLQMGRTRNEVLRELGIRTGVEDLRALAAILIQADKFGSSIAQALRVQSDSMRIKRSQLAEEKAAKTAVKLIFPLVIFIFPGIFVVLIGPAAITMVNDMFPAMGG